MKYTAEDARSMPAGCELDSLIAEILGVEPRITWHWLNADESASAAKYEYKHEAESRLAETLADYPNSWLKDYHVGSLKHYPFFSRNIQAAWQIVEHFGAGKGKYSPWYEMSYRPTGAQASFTGNRWQAGYASFDECPDSREHCTALAICRAALLAELERLPA